MKVVFAIRAPVWGGSKFAPAIGTSLVALATIAVTVGAIRMLPSGLGLREILRTLIPLLVGIAIMLRGPVPTLALLAFTGSTGWGISFLSVGGFDLLLVDLPYLGLVGWWLFTVATDPTRQGAAKILAPALVPLLVVALSVLMVMAVDPGFADVSSISLMRLLQTASIAPMAARIVGGARSADRVVQGLLAGAMLAVLIAISDASGAESSGLAVERFSGIQALGGLGLISGMLVVSALFGRSLPMLMRVAAFPLGLVGLFLSKSVGSAVATCLVLLIGSLTANRQGGSRRGVTLVIALAVAVGVIALRPGAIPGTGDYIDSSADHRQILAGAGLKIFADNPLVGVGWRRSGDVGIIGSPEVASFVRGLFPGRPYYYYPDAAPTSVHNAYIQILAELGIIGMILVLVAGALMYRSFKEVGRRIPHDSAAEAIFRLCLLLGVLVLLWFNDSAIFGGQPETVSLAIVLGVAAGVAFRYQSDGADILATPAA